MRTRPARPAGSAGRRRRRTLTIARAEQKHAPALHALITANLEEGRLLPRTLDEIAVHANRFSIVMRGRNIVGCAELAPLSAHVAEVRSLAVDTKERGNGVGRILVDDLRQRAHDQGFDKLSAFTHAPGYFSQMGFSIVPHLWIQEKIFTDCVKCPSFRRCGQYAMVAPLDAPAAAEVPVTIPLDRLRQGDGGHARA
jgi:amino-acid N-acetyltransferase